MLKSNDDFGFLRSNQRLLLKGLLERLKTNSWPLRIADLPPQCALVGGAIRDAFLDRLQERPDLDFVVMDNAIDFTRNLASKIDGKCIILDQKRNIARLIIKDWSLDFATLIGNNLEEDLLRRDFRLNAIALRIGPEPFLIDPINGLQDLINRKIVAIDENNLIDDPLRLIRGFRLKCELNFSFDKRTEDLLRKHSDILENVSPDRIKIEILKIINAKWDDNFLKDFKDSGLLEKWTYKKLRNPIHIYLNEKINSETTELSSARRLSRLCVLLSDEGLEFLRFSKDEINCCKKLRSWIQKVHAIGMQNLSEEDRFQLHLDCEKFLPALILFLPDEYQSDWMLRWRDLSDPLFHPSCPIDGFTLQESFGVPPGPRLGALMRCLTKENAFRRIQTNEQALKLACYLSQQN